MVGAEADPLSDFFRGEEDFDGRMGLKRDCRSRERGL